MSNHEVHNTLKRIDTIREWLADRVDFNASTLSAEFNVSTRTCLRDLYLLRDIYGVVIEYDEAKRTYSVKDPGRDLALRYLLQGKPQDNEGSKTKNKDKCVICGNSVEGSPWQKTCSETCNKERHRRMARKRYWRRKKRMESDPAYRERWRIKRMEQQRNRELKKMVSIGSELVDRSNR